MNKFDVVYCCSDSSYWLEHQYKEVKKYLNKIKVFHLKVLMDECNENSVIVKRKRFKELQYYIDTNRIKTLFVPSLKVLGNDIRIITNYIIFLYRAGVVIKVANKDERKFVQEIIRTVHIASNKIKEK